MLNVSVMSQRHVIARQYQVQERSNENVTNKTVGYRILVFNYSITVFEKPYLYPNLTCDNSCDIH